MNLSDDGELLDLMVRANFTWVFLGIESPSVESLKETRKFQNLKGSLEARVHKIQSAGLLVFGGFIIGFDSDGEDIFARQIEFIGQAAITNAMIGPLVALPGTPLYARMKQAGRLLTGDGRGHDRTIASGYTNIVTLIPEIRLLQGHCHILQSIYAPEEYFKRAFAALCHLPHPGAVRARIARALWLGHVGVSFLLEGTDKTPTLRSFLRQLRSFYRILQRLPVHYKRASLSFAWKVIIKCPDQMPFILPFILIGFHYYMFTFAHMLPELSASIKRLAAAERRTRRSGMDAAGKAGCLLQQQDSASSARQTGPFLGLALPANPRMDASNDWNGSG